MSCYVATAKSVNSRTIEIGKKDRTMTSFTTGLIVKSFCGMCNIVVTRVVVSLS